MQTTQTIYKKKNSHGYSNKYKKTSQNIPNTLTFLYKRFVSSQECFNSRGWYCFKAKNIIYIKTEPKQKYLQSPWKG